jgi:hypothetical protein
MDLGGALPSGQYPAGTVVVDVGCCWRHFAQSMLWVGPFTTASSAFVHANLNWTWVVQICHPASFPPLAHFA